MGVPRRSCGTSRSTTSSRHSQFAAVCYSSPHSALVACLLTSARRCSKCNSQFSHPNLVKNKENQHFLHPSLSLPSFLSLSAPPPSSPKQKRITVATSSQYLQKSTFSHNMYQTTMTTIGNYYYF